MDPDLVVVGGQLHRDREAQASALRLDRERRLHRIGGDRHGRPAELEGKLARRSYIGGRGRSFAHC
jgi:hypothetical protein